MAHPNVLREIPDFILESIVHCDRLTFKKNEKSVFVLAKNLKFYEFRKKQLQHSLDLNETCVKQLEKNIKIVNNAKDTYASENHPKTQDPIKLGKYFFRNFEISKLYLLLQCWDKLIIMEHQNTNGLKLIGEFEKVTGFQCVPSNLMKYQSELRIVCNDGSIISTDFQDKKDNDWSPNSVSNSNCKVTQKTEFKHLLEKVRTTKAELQLHKEITQKQFQSQANEQNFGNNFLRSTKLEEKALLSKCGDLWIRIAANDELVLGVPLVNNCAPPNLTIIKNLQPILNINDEESTTATQVNMSKNLNFEHRLYQLRQTFENLETLETVFQTQDDNFQGTFSWQKETTNTLLPNGFFVLLLKLKISQVIFLNTPCQLFVRFDVEKDLETLESQTQLFQQHIFVKTLDFLQVLHQRSLYEISFQAQSLHQDLLAVAMVSYDIKLRIEFATKNDFEKFERLLAAKFDFNFVYRTSDSHSCDDTTTMEVDEPSENGANKCVDAAYYNRQANSLWFGSLILRHATDDTVAIFKDEVENFKSDWVFYNKNEEKSLLMIKFLFDELLSLKCNIKSIKNLKRYLDCGSKVIAFENAIRQELIAFSNLNQNVNDLQEYHEKYKALAERQFYTDLMAAEL